VDEVKLLKGGQRVDPHPSGEGRSQPRVSRRTARRSETDSRIRQLLWDYPRGLTVGEVARALSLGRSSAARLLDALARKGEIDLATYGQTRVFTLPRRASLDSTLSRPLPLVLSLSHTLRVLDVNDPFLAAFRLRREDILGRPLEKTPLARCVGKRLLSAIREGMGGVAGFTEFECLIGDSPHVFRAGIMPLSPARGRRGVVVSLEDITGTALQKRRLEGLMDEGTLGLLSSHPGLIEEILERKRDEEQMEAIRFSVDRAAVAALWIGKDGRFLRVNHAATLLLGYTKDELARLAFSDIDLDHPSGTWGSLWEILRARSAISFESRFRTKAGATLLVDLRASHLVHRDREFALLFMEDITRRKEGEEALRASEATLRAFLDANPDPSLLIDPEGHVLLANHAGSALFGTDLPRLIGTSVFDAMPGKAEGAREALRGVVAERRGRIFTEEISGRHFHTILSPLLNPEGEVERIAIFARDFTDRKRIEDALRQVNERLNLLTAVTRHDVLNDITALGMYLALPGMATGSGPSGALEKLVPLIRSLQRKMEFTRDYADLGMKMPGWEDVDGAVRAGVAGMNTGSLRIDLDLASLEVYVDPLFGRAVSNLVDNTLRHGEHASRIRFRAVPEGDACVLVVEDDGVGVPSGMKEPIFRQGYGRHTGFGLFLVREILGITGMSIRETGEPGKGARFEIRIPGGGFRMKTGSGDACGNACA
jgi:PAS domain S-box-containing protein